MKVKTLKALLAKHDDDTEVITVSWAHGNVDLLHDVDTYEMFWRGWFNSDVTVEKGGALEHALNTLDEECESDPETVVILTKPLCLRNYPDWIDQEPAPASAPQHQRGQKTNGVEQLKQEEEE